MPSIRLDKFISERTEYSRSQIKQLCARGAVSVNGRINKKSDIKIDPDTDRVSVEGRELSENRYTYILLNKPQGYVCSTDEKDGETVLKLIPENLRTKNMFPAGRLDKDSTGALLITDDGETAHRMLSPKRHIPKIYMVRLSEPFDNDYIERFSGGIVLSNGETCLPAKVIKAENNDRTALIELHEGKYHQVKRMFAAVGNHVESLTRLTLGGLVLPENLPLGGCVCLLPKDIEQMFTAIDSDKLLQALSRQTK